jgi:Copper resistance protein D
LSVVAVLLVSGFYLAEASLTTPQQLVSDPYGRALLVEWLLVAVMLGLSAFVLLILRPRLIRQAVLLPVVNAEMPARRARQSAMDQTARGLKQALVIQSWLGAAVLLCAAIMSFFAPPIVFPAVDYNAVANSGSLPTTNAAQTKQVGNLSITLQVLPGQVGYANMVIVTMKDTSSGAYITDAQVQMTTNMEIMDMGTAHATIKSGNPTYIATFGSDTVFSMFGAWDIRLTIQRPHQAAVQTLFTVVL